VWRMATYAGSIAAIGFIGGVVGGPPRGELNQPPPASAIRGEPVQQTSETAPVASKSPKRIRQT
jgi:hypothetical protein